MTGTDCDQMAIDNDWSLARQNSCHIAVQNDEMGVLANAQVEMNARIDVIALKLDFMIGLMTICAVCLIGMLFKRVFTKNISK